MEPAVPVYLAAVDMSDPDNAEWLTSEMRVASFPVGKLYEHGTSIGTYLKGPSANEIAQEMMRLADGLASRSARSKREGRRGGAAG